MSGLLALLLLGATPAAAQPEKPKSEQWDVRLRKYKGEVQLRLAGTKRWLTPKKGTPLETGDEIRIGASGYAEISFGADSIVHLRPKTNLVIEDTRISAPTLMLKWGILLQKIKSLKVLRKRYSSAGMTWKVRTKNAHAAVRGTEFGVQVSTDGITTAGVFDEGKVDLVPAEGGDPARMGPNQEAVVNDAGAIGAVGPLSDLLAYRTRMRALRKTLLRIQRRYRSLPIQKRRQLREALKKRRK